jgi:hypothetical protein
MQNAVLLATGGNLGRDVAASASEPIFDLGSTRRFDKAPSEVEGLALAATNQWLFLKSPKGRLLMQWIRHDCHLGDTES